MTNQNSNCKSLKSLLSRANSHDPNHVLVFAGYEFEQGVAWADMQWIKALIKYWSDKDQCGLDIEDIAEISGLTIEEVEDLLGLDIDNLMGAPVW